MRCINTRCKQHIVQGKAFCGLPRCRYNPGYQRYGPLTLKQRVLMAFTLCLILGLLAGWAFGQSYRTYVDHHNDGNCLAECWEV
jgi:hypothetical protein